MRKGVGIGSAGLPSYNVLLEGHTQALENDTFTPSAANQIKVSGGGLTGLVLQQDKNRLYTLTRFDKAHPGKFISFTEPTFRRAAEKDYGKWQAD